MTARWLRRALAATAGVCAVASVAVAGSARAGEPWWHVSVSARPSALQPGGEQAEVGVQQIETVPSVTGRLRFELLVEGKSIGVFWNQSFSYGSARPASAAAIQGALEGPYGEGGVIVEGGPAPATLTVTTLDRDIGHPLAPLELRIVEKEGKGQARVVSSSTTDVVAIALLASNLGDGPADGSASPVVVAGGLPSGLEALAIAGATADPRYRSMRAPVLCTLSSLSCAYGGALPAYEAIEAVVWARVSSGAQAGEEVTASVEGGGAPSAAGGSLTTRFGEPSFGVQGYELAAEAEGGGPASWAGSHPFQLTTTVTLSQTAELEPVALAKDLVFRLPPGLVGNPTAYPTCTTGQFLKLQPDGADECRPDTALGVAIVSYRLKQQFEVNAVPVFNLEPERGEPARFGFLTSGGPVVLDAAVRTGGDYGITVSVPNITQIASFLSSQVVFWGVPGSSVHDFARGNYCLAASFGVNAACSPLEERNPQPFLSLPGSCAGPLLSSVQGDSWQYVPFEAVSFSTPALYGCNKLLFEPTIKAAPDLEDASSPSGLTVDVHVPQELQTNATATAEAEVKQIEVVLPEGVTLNPGGAGGLAACPLLRGKDPAQEQLEAQGKLNGIDLETPRPANCPKQSKIGTVTIHTPLLPHPLEGAVYLATPDPLGTAELGDNPFDALIAMYLVAEDPVSGTLVKLAMHVQLNETTGQVTTTVENPQLPFEDAELHFFGGGRAPLATPALCGSYTTAATFTPWSGQAPAGASSTFDITSGPNGVPCANPRPFAPEFQAGTTNVQAGAFSPFTTTMGHPDADQTLGGLSIKLPPGLMGTLSSVKLCPEPQASEGTCGPESLIGHTTVTAGLGSTPAVVSRPGNVYITGPYGGAPYGLSIANPAETGPFDLQKGTGCDCIVVRAKIEVDPLTAQLTVASDPLPTMLRGIPLELQHVNVTIDRPGFTFNPTSCEKMKIEGTMTSSEGATAAIFAPFQVTDCAALAFKPKLTASTSGRTSRNDGASLNVKLTYPKAPWGTQANVAKVKVSLPKQLPSRLTTLQKGCPDRTFEANPAACPSASRVGYAKAITPVLPVALEGPAYFVSHGGAKFPELIVVLQGYGVTVHLNGETYISPKGITSSTFRQVPDVPVQRFELTLPQGPYSALGANGSLCKVKGGLKMPTAFVAQNGMQIKQTTKIGVSGCAKPKAKKRAGRRKR